MSATIRALDILRPARSLSRALLLAAGSMPAGVTAAGVAVAATLEALRPDGSEAA